MPTAVDKAIDCLKEGRFVLVYDFDNRERETDMVIASEFVTPAAIRTMRKDAGGLICTTASFEISQKLHLPFLVDVLACNYRSHPMLKKLAPNDIPYDTKSAFSITINHRKTFTGITDNDRAMTTSEFAKLARFALNNGEEAARDEFGRNFRSPGHVHLLNSSKELLVARKGHTELCTALVTMAKLTPTATICEMMGDDGNALTKEKAREYAKNHDLCFLEGQEIIDAWRGAGSAK
ncbi:MAG TPA: 3,4-dihydroxy-2-butanone-4-phosphate synthase [Methanomassiliicoccales archaeon]|nr:3,4-dihydroxy-2-butanone-4-phosphate synthase [Methanomassiliicoccales archaeon]